jgi:hypothetical protein
MNFGNSTPNSIELNHMKSKNIAHKYIFKNPVHIRPWETSTKIYHYVPRLETYEIPHHLALIIHIHDK